MTRRPGQGFLLILNIQTTVELKGTGMQGVKRKSLMFANLILLVFQVQKIFWRQQQCESDNGQMFQNELCETEDVFTERILATYIDR